MSRKTDISIIANGRNRQELDDDFREFFLLTSQYLNMSQFLSLNEINASNFSSFLHGGSGKVSPLALERLMVSIVSYSNVVLSAYDDFMTGK